MEEKKDDKWVDNVDEAIDKDLEWRYSLTTTARYVTWKRVSKINWREKGCDGR